jgi:hypothetical protein
LVGATSFSYKNRSCANRIPCLSLILQESIDGAQHFRFCRKMPSLINAPESLGQVVYRKWSDRRPHDVGSRRIHLPGMCWQHALTRRTRPWRYAARPLFDDLTPTALRIMEDPSPTYIARLFPSLCPAAEPEFATKSHYSFLK